MSYDAILKREGCFCQALCSKSEFLGLIRAYVRALWRVRANWTLKAPSPIRSATEEKTQEGAGCLHYLRIEPTGIFELIDPWWRLAEGLVEENSQMATSTKGVLQHERACTLVILVDTRIVAKVGSSVELQLFVGPPLEKSKP